MELKKGEFFNFCGHKVQVVRVISEYFGIRRLRLSCAPHCCTRPNHITMEFSEQDEEIIKLLKK